MIGSPDSSGTGLGSCSCCAWAADAAAEVPLENYFLGSVLRKIEL